MNTPLLLAGLPRRLRTPAMASPVLVLPFVILELVNRRSYHEPFPIPLFALLWLLPLSFMVILLPTRQSPPVNTRSLALRLSFVARLILLFLIACLWIGIVIDQIPCFLGVLYCD